MPFEQKQIRPAQNLVGDVRGRRIFRIFIRVRGTNIYRSIQLFQVSRALFETRRECRGHHRRRHPQRRSIDRRVCSRVRGVFEMPVLSPTSRVIGY